jgi:hypothetical protein
MRPVRCTDVGHEVDNFTKGKVYEVTSKGFKNDKDYIYESFLTDPECSGNPAERWLGWTKPLRINFELVTSPIRRF